MNICRNTVCNKETTNPKYCSLSCSARSQPRTKKSVVKICENEKCSTDFNAVGPKKKQRYCSRSCAASVSNKITKVKTGKYVAGTVCNYCFTKVKGANSFFCSPACSNKDRKEKRIEQWLSGEWVPTSEYSVPLSIRTYLMEKAGFRCTSSSCCVPGGWQGINPKSGKSTLTIDHKDGNASNNTPNNLQVLCPNCHSLTPTYGALNKGNGRSYRYASLG